MSSNRLSNFIGGKFVEVEGVECVPVVSPSTEEIIAQVPLSKASHLDEAVKIAQKAYEEWSSVTIKQRTAIMLKFHHLMDVHSQELAEIIVKENGKNIAEALADVAKGNETVEWACSLPQLATGRILEVSRGITCHETRQPLGVVAAIVPFNFPGKGFTFLSLFS
jgi:malonate-semialdehyde dehydrogenase (acetylating)/methylmalonate-semialdehyde dehydrogenase